MKTLIFQLTLNIFMGWLVASTSSDVYLGIAVAAAMSIYCWFSYKKDKVIEAWQKLYEDVRGQTITRLLRELAEERKNGNSR
jgi:hypothetical protein